MTKVVIANSVGIDSRGKYIIHSPSRWSVGVEDEMDWFTYYPWELAYLSSLLKRKTDAEVKFIDGCLKKLNLEHYLQSIIKEKPQWLVMEPSSRTIRDDFALALRVKEELGTRIVLAGQHATAFPEELLHQGADYICIGEYELTVVDLIKGLPSDQIPGLYPNGRRPLLDVNQLPYPEDDDVSRLDYAIPGEPNCDYVEIQAYASRGCPMSCTFCVARNIYYGHPRWRGRRVEDVVAEIKYLKQKYPRMEGVFFDEEEHNANKGFIMELTRAISKEGLDNLRYNAMCGYWTLDREMLQAMADAGYYKIRVGIETASEVVASAIKKPIDLRRVYTSLSLAKEVGLKTYGTFIIGAPMSTRGEDMKTIGLIKRLVRDGLLDGLQVSITTPQPGTPFYYWAEERGFLLKQNWSRFDGGANAVVSYPDYPKEEIEEVFNLASEVRDHMILVRKMREEGMGRLFKSARARYGGWTALRKAVRRMGRELDYRRRLHRENKR
ncbi:radical SAM protein [bacterium (candidate division B38) B3_B38]|nr:MAG: radical SAM protein [bacterium (candidate division B38) B3_B38]